MTEFVPSSSVLLPACNDVLMEKLVPIHYRELTELAALKLGYRSGQVNMFRAIEDVREKLPMRKDLGIFYTGRPLCLMAKESWFTTEQLMLLNPDSIVIPGNANSGFTGAFEALMRSEHMQDHWHGNTELRNKNRAQGLVVEHHVSEWFRLKWPSLYAPPDNYRQWQRPCSHDFKLIVNGKTIFIDVAGYGKNGYRNPGKKSTHLHLLCRIYGASVLWEGVATGVMFDDTITAETAKSPVSLVVSLNCHASGIDYKSLRNKFYYGAEKSA